VTSQDAALPNGGASAERPRQKVVSPDVPRLLAVSCAYLTLTLVITWPLCLGLTRDIPGNLADPLLNCWILSWDAHRMLLFLHGGSGALAGFWNGNIFFPEPLTLAYSDHLLPEAIQILPIYALTGNPILCYNLLFLSTFVLSALGMYLLVHEWTGRCLPAFVAGLIFGFAPCRMEHLSHVQILSSEWMPLTLWGFSRHLRTRGLWPLLAGAAALVMQNLSCGYFLAYFCPLALAYVLYEVFDRGLIRDVRLSSRLSTAALLVLAATLPFLSPFLELRARGLLHRPLWEVERYSADVYSYLTAPVELRVWGPLLQTFPKGEGHLFPGLIPLLLAALGLGAHLIRVWSESRRPSAPLLRFRNGLERLRAILVVLGLIALTIELAAVALIVSGGGQVYALPGVTLRFQNLPSALWRAGAAFLALLLLSPRARTLVRGRSGSSVGVFVIGALAAFVLSLGPTLHSMGE
jgi:hypothetical protein